MNITRHQVKSYQELEPSYATQSKPTKVKKINLLLKRSQQLIIKMNQRQQKMQSPRSKLLQQKIGISTDKVLNRKAVGWDDLKRDSDAKTVFTRTTRKRRNNLNKSRRGLDTDQGSQADINMQGARQTLMLFENARIDPYLGVPLVGYKDIVCGSESSDFEDLGKYIEEGKIPNFGYPLPCQFPLEPEKSLEKYKPEWHTLTKYSVTLQRMLQKQA